MEQFKFVLFSLKRDIKWKLGLALTKKSGSVGDFLNNKTPKEKSEMEETTETLEMQNDQTSNPEQPKIPGCTLNELEKFAILETLKSVNGSTTKASKILGVSVRKIQYCLKEWGLNRSRK